MRAKASSACFLSFCGKTPPRGEVRCRGQSVDQALESSRGQQRLGPGAALYRPKVAGAAAGGALFPLGYICAAFPGPDARLYPVGNIRP